MVGRKLRLVLVFGILWATMSILSHAQSNSEPETTIHYKWKLKVNLKKADFLDASTFQYPDLVLITYAWRKMKVETIGDVIEFDWDPTLQRKKRFHFYGDGIGRSKGNPSEMAFYRVYSRSIRFTKSRKVLRLRVIEMHI